MHEDCLPPATLDLLGRIATVARPHGLALGDGSACALHLGHRTSADLDLRREWSVEEAVEFFGREAERLLAP